MVCLKIVSQGNSYLRKIKKIKIIKNKETKQTLQGEQTKLGK